MRACATTTTTGTDTGAGSALALGYIEVANCTMVGSTVVNGFGGSLHVAHLSTASVTNTTFDGCNAAYGGGAIAIVEAVARVTTSSFTDCFCGSSGGAIYAAYAALSVSQASFTFDLSSGVSKMNGANAPGDTNGGV